MEKETRQAELEIKLTYSRFSFMIFILISQIFMASFFIKPNILSFIMAVLWFIGSFIISYKEHKA